MKMMIVLVMMLVVTNNALAYDFKITTEWIGFEYEYQLEKYAKMTKAKNRVGVDDVLKHAKIIKSNSEITLDRLIIDLDEVIVGRFIVEGHKNFLFSSILKEKLIKNTGKPDNSATDSILGKKTK